MIRTFFWRRKVRRIHLYAPLEQLQEMLKTAPRQAYGSIEHTWLRGFTHGREIHAVISRREE